jgi:hypothetical protein
MSKLREGERLSVSLTPRNARSSEPSTSILYTSIGGRF